MKVKKFNLSENKKSQSHAHSHDKKKFVPVKYDHQSSDEEINPVDIEIKGPQ